jgi:hypothetical protein
MPVRLVNGEERLTVWKWDVQLPPEIEADAVDMPDAHCSLAGDKAASIGRVLDRVRQYVMDLPPR